MKVPVPSPDLRWERELLGAVAVCVGVQNLEVLRDLAILRLG